MRRVTGTLALIMLAATGIAAAQMTPSQTQPPAGSTPPQQYPSQSPSSAQPSSSMSSSGKATQKQQIKDCIAQQKANNTSMSKHEMKKYCESQVGSPQSSSAPHD